jgi:ATP-dependent Clp protease ATP-binding subunit ClpC
MFERFTDRARRVVVLAQEEARILNHNYIGTEHILLGLLREGGGVAAKALESLGLRLEAVRQQVEEIIGKGQHAPSGHIPFTPRAKKVLELSLREALQLGHDYIGTEHILLGLLSEGEGVAAQVLVRLGADLKRVRQQVIQLLHGGQVEAAGAGPRRLTITREFWLTEIQNTLTSIADRLTAIERHLGVVDRPAAAAGPGDPPATAPGDRPAAAPDDSPAAAPDGPLTADSDDPPPAASDGT